MNLDERLHPLTATDLVAAWIYLHRPCGEPFAPLLDYLGEETGVRPAKSRLGEWRNGKRPVPPAVQRVMRRDVCRYLLADDSDGDRLAALLEPKTT